MDQKTMNSLVINTRAYYEYQSESLRIDGWMGQKKSGELKKGAPERDLSKLMVLLERKQTVDLLQKHMEKEIAKTIKGHPLWTAFLKDVKGVGPVMAAVIITQFDIHKAPMVSNLVSFAGMAPGKDKKVKRQKCSYNQFLKSKMMGVLAASFLKCQSPYSQIYYDTKNRLENSDRLVTTNKKGGGAEVKKWKDVAKGHRHYAACRKMLKYFLKDLYVAWRTLENLPIRKPYEEEYLGKVHGGAHEEVFAYEPRVCV